MKVIRLGIMLSVLLVSLGMTLVAARAYAQNGNAAMLIERKGCLNCHSLFGKGGKMGPPLQATPAWSGPERMRAYIKDPKSVNPKSVMPASHLSDADINAIVDYLQSYKKDAKAPAGWKPN